MNPPELNWQSKAVVLIVLPAVAVDVVLQSAWWARALPAVAQWTLGISAALGLVAWAARAATPFAAAAGAAVSAGMMYSTSRFPYSPWRSALLPVLGVLVLTSVATRIGRRRKRQLGTAEASRGRNAAQVAANLGVAALATTAPAQNWMETQPWLPLHAGSGALLFAAGLAALCEAAADTVSSELGQVLSGRPRLITTLRIAAPGTDGAISLGGSLAGIAAALVVAALGGWAVGGSTALVLIGASGGIFGLFFDSLMGATIERRQRVNNDAVNFLATLSAALCALLLLALLPRFAGAAALR